ncbi:hypothetical protein FRC20_002555 [Serendipita sp. 405]|nr:hypothetical protein FRC15_002136 [Serendipita sp. 397]KAG8839703.1 hypothetical protein FRC18_008423 [Serendipita sp. 400]KAG8875991.1 hypothetical protein FRC20_002555 [Serendipita sp. 405]
MSFHDGGARDAGKRKERPPSLSLSSQERDSNDSTADQPRPSMGSFTSNSSLDPYYFTATIPRPIISSTPEPMPVTHSAATQNSNVDTIYEPKTPSSHPSTIDRAGLVGVGELTTPRWTTRAEFNSRSTPWKSLDFSLVKVDEDNSHLAPKETMQEVNQEQDNDLDRSSPWTIEAVDESDTNEQSYIVPSPPPNMNTTQESQAARYVGSTSDFRSVRAKPSAEESAGEEILYPRKSRPNTVPSTPLVQSDTQNGATSYHRPSPSRAPISTQDINHSPNVVSSTSGSTYAQTPQRHQKRPSDDVSSAISSNKGGEMTTSKDDTRARRHRSLGVTPVIPPVSQQRERGKEKRRQDVSNSVSSPTRSSSTPKESTPKEKHVRRSSASAAASSPAPQSETAHSRRTNDFSHLPPSPSSTTLQHILKSTSINHTGAPSSPPAHASVGSTSSVAHSLLRGTQEGWSGMDDSATAEALRKLDGISGRSLKARSSVISVASKSSSRPGTPGSKSGHQWEGMESGPLTKRRSMNMKEAISSNSSGQTTVAPTPAVSSSYMQERDVGDMDMTTIKSSNTPLGMRSAGPSPVKRGSGGSTHTHFTSTGTPSSASRDSTSVSTSTSVTSTYVSSHRHSLTSSGKLKRSNSTGSDSSSIHSERDRAASLAAVGDTEPMSIPPVPPLPKAYQTPPGSAHHNSAHSSNGQFLHDPPEGGSIIPQVDIHSPSKPPSTLDHSDIIVPPPQSSNPAPAPRTPSKKWSFPGLNIRLASGSKDATGAGPLSPISPRKSLSSRSVSGSSPSVKQQPLPERNSSSVERKGKHAANASPSVSSLAPPRSPSPRHSNSSLRHDHGQHQLTIASVPPVPSPTRRSSEKQSRPGSSSSHYTNTTSVHVGHTKEGQINGSPSRRPSTTRRLTPSSIPFFRRSSTHSINSPNIGVTSPSMPPPPLMSPTSSGSLQPTSPLMPVMSNGLAGHSGHSPTTQLTRITPPTADITSSPGSSSHRKSMLMGFQLLKGSSSRRSVHGSDKSDVEKKQREERSREREKEKEREKAKEKERRKEEKKEERSESRISVLMGRRRGKTLSSTDARKSKAPDPELPPMQMPGIPSSTAQRVANLRASVASGAHKIGIPSTPPSKSKSTLNATSSSPSSPSQKTPTVLTKSSDVSLRSNNRPPQLYTIAGSPSVSTVGSKEGAAVASAVNGTPTGKDGPSSSTKIPRISSRTSAGGSPQPLKSSMATSKRGSVTAQSTAASEVSTALDEFGLLDTPVNKATTTVGNNRYSTRASPQSSKQPRYAANTISSSVSASSIRKPSRDSSVSYNPMRKSSTTSVDSLSSSLASSSLNTAGTPPQRFSALSPAKSIKLLSPKAPLQSPRVTGVSGSPALRQGSSSSSDRHSFSTPSPVPAPIDEEELLGDEEMMEYIRRQHARKMANGAKKEDLEEMLKFPEPIAPAPALTPQALLKSSQAVYLSDYERREVLDYDYVYYIGAQSDKKPATRDHSTNNYSYDDDRGDYQVVLHDHLAYRYEVIDTLGKGSFGQVLHCRDHCTGESVAIKIIRNKKRFHHQALVEIKILDNLRKWDPDEKHYVIKMTEHFYFRNHLCIAMELLSINLYELIKANGFVGFTTTLIRRFTSQMLGSLALMRHHRVVHCDLKPENILLRHPAKSAIKVIDFGSSCLENEKVYTYIQSRFYRSPEVILGMSYSMAIDMWSLGCILAELYTGFPIFPGENEQEQLACIMEVLGVPEKDIIQRSSRRRIFFDSSGAPRPVVNSKGRRRRPGTKTLSQVLRCDDQEFVDFIAKCLVWDPERRMKPQTAMRHPFITGGRSKNKIPLSGSSSRGLLGSSSTVSRISRLTSSSSHQTTEINKKMIGPPTPLSARTARLSTGPSNVPTSGPSSGPLSGPSSGISTSVSTGGVHATSSTQRTLRYNLAAGAKLS